MNFQMLDVLRRPGDRLVWDFRGSPSLVESYVKDTVLLVHAKIQNLLSFSRSNDSPGRYALRVYSYWPECGHVGVPRGSIHVPWFLVPTPAVLSTYGQIKGGLFSGREYVRAWVCKQWYLRYIHACNGIKWARRRLVKCWDYVPDEAKYAGLAFVVWRLFCLLRSSWQERRNIFDGQESIAFCAHCTPELLDDNEMVLGNAYEKKFHVPAACPRCSRIWVWKGWEEVRMRIGNSHYQFLGTYSALRMQRARDIHCPAVNQLDIPNEYRFAHRFMQMHSGTIGLLESKQRWFWSRHTRSYCLATQWEKVKGGDAAVYQPPRPTAPAIAAAQAAAVAVRAATAAAAAAAVAPATAPAAPKATAKACAPAAAPAPAPAAAVAAAPKPKATAKAPPPPAKVGGYTATTAAAAAAKAPLSRAPMPPLPAVPAPPAPVVPTVAVAAATLRTSMWTATTSSTHIQKMRDLWQFANDNMRYYPQSTLLWSPYTRCRELLGRKPEPVFNMTAHFRMGILGVGTRILDARFMTPPTGIDMAPMPRDSAQAVGPITHPVTIHNAQDKTSVVANLEGRSSVKQSVFPLAHTTGGSSSSTSGVATTTYPDLCYNKSSKAALRLHKFWNKFNQLCLTDKAIDNAYHKLFAGKTFKEIAMSKFSQEEIDAIAVELQSTTKAEWIGTRKANGKIESVVKEGKPGRLVIDNTLQLLAINIIATAIYQHIIFDKDDGIFYSMSIKHRARDDVLDSFGEMMKDPWGDKKRVKNGRAPKVPETCAWEIDQTMYEIHQRCNKNGEGILSYSYNALMRINRRVSNKINGEFTGLHEAKIVYDVKTGMRLRFRINSPEVPKETWFTAKFPDMYLDSGWALTSGVNFMDELSGVYSSITEDPWHLLAINHVTKRFRLQEGTFDWEFQSIPLYQTLLFSPAPSSFRIFLRGMFEGDDGGGAGSRCLADERNSGKQGLIIAQQEQLGKSAKLKTIIDGRLEIIGAHYPVKDGLVCNDVPWMPAVLRYIPKIGVQTNVNITPSSTAARFLSLASMFAGRIEPLQRGFDLSATRVIEKHGKEKNFWTSKIKTDGHHEIDRAFGDGTHCTYTMKDVKAYYDRCADKVHQTTQTQIRMLNMSIAEDVDGSLFTRDDFAMLGLFADECRNFDSDDESVYSFLPNCLR